MLHQWMFWIMLLLCGFRLSGLTFLLSNDLDRLPTVIYYSAGVAIFLGLVLLCKRIILSFLINLIVMKASRPLVVYNTDLIVTGTLFDILISIVLVIEAAVEHQHIRLEPAEPAEPNKSI